VKVPSCIIFVYVCVYGECYTSRSFIPVTVGKAWDFWPDSHSHAEELGERERGGGGAPGHT